MSSTIPTNISTLPGKGASKLKPSSKPASGKPAHLPGKAQEKIKSHPATGTPATLPGKAQDEFRPSSEVIRGGGGSFPAAPGAPKHGGGKVDSSQIDQVISNLTANFGR